MAIMDDLEFEEHIKEFTSEGKFLSRQLHSQEKRCELCQAGMDKHFKSVDSRLDALEARDRKTFGIAGGIGGGVAAGAAGLGAGILWLIKHWPT